MLDRACLLKAVQLYVCGWFALLNCMICSSPASAVIVLLLLYDPIPVML